MRGFILKQKDAVDRQYEGPNTFFFFDPPFVGYDQAVGKKKFNEGQFAKFPSKPGKREAVVQYHFIGKSFHLEVRMQVDGWYVGWTLSIQRSGSVDSPVDTIEAAQRLAGTFSIKGSEVSKPIVSPARVLAIPKSKVPVKWIDADKLVIDEGDFGASQNEKGVIVTLDRTQVEYGVQRKNFHEYFFSGGKHLNGRLILRRQSGNKQTATEPYWTAHISNNRLPSILDAYAVGKKIMPPEGYSAIPQSLERVTPQQYRYWTKKGEEARGIRDALVESGYFVEDNVTLVDSEFRRLIRKYYLTLDTPDAYNEADVFVLGDPVNPEEKPELELPRAIRKIAERYFDICQPIVKRGTDEERYTLGIVLEPDVVDAQGDRYSKEEVRKACHRFGEFYWNADLIHKKIVNGKIVVLENYIAPFDFTAENGKKIKEGTWLQGRGYRDDAIWNRVKRRVPIGLSISGSAIRRKQMK